MLDYLIDALASCLVGALLVACLTGNLLIAGLSFFVFLYLGHKDKL